jgi:uncharacterized tellurite resistance protein B-like protein
VGESIIVGWFNKEEKKVTSSINPSEMSPIESVTFLCTAIQISDGQIDNEEKNIWIELVSELFPEFSEERASKFFSEAQVSLYSKNNIEKKELTVKVMKRIKDLLDTDKINLVGKKIADLVEADGMVMSGEIEIIKLIEENLNVKINYDKEL